MIKVYEVYCKGFSASDTGQLNVSRKWGLPGVTCSVCNETWAQTGIAYPSVDLSALPGESEYRRTWPVPFVKFDEKRRSLLNLIPNGSLPPPGTEFGPLVGVGKGDFDDFVWVNPWTLLARPEALEQLTNGQVKLPLTVPALITFRNANVGTLVELQIEPRKLISSAAFRSDLPQCPACGRVQAETPDNIIVKESSIPSSVDIFRDRLISTVILATGRLVEAVKSLKLSGIQFKEVVVI